MRRDEVLHVARAAAGVAGVTNVVIVGSQAVHGTYEESELPSPALAFPDGWEGRLSHLVAGQDGEVEYRAYFPEIHDLCATKLGAGRPHDRTFAHALFTHRRGDGSPLLDGARLAGVARRLPDHPPGVRDRAESLVEALLRGAEIRLRSPPT